jgi:hypothetical protein
VEQSRLSEIANYVSLPQFDFPDVSQIARQTLGFAESLSPILERHEAIDRALEQMRMEQERLRDFAESISAVHFDVPDLTHFARQATLDLQFDEIRKSFKDLPPRTQEALLILGEHGWFLDMDMSLPGLWELKRALAEGEVEEAEEALAEYFQGRVDEIEASIVERYPHRAHLIRAAFRAHRLEEYVLSIPVLLAQVDGICKEVFDQYFFRKKNKRPRTAIYVDQIVQDTYRAALLSPLARILPINASEGERAVDCFALNRHTVLHGESLDYGNKSNGLKAISLINYVARVLEVEESVPTDRGA